MSIDGSLENYSRQKTNTLENDPLHLDTITEDPSDDNHSQNKESDVPETSTTTGLIKPNLRMRQLTKMSLGVITVLERLLRIDSNITRKLIPNVQLKR
ncbi:6068_t:CDS:2 [Entrophospora sp. SA101]|nr:6068_t:CDS:2 [Entrophospora sp. SA101]